MKALPYGWVVAFATLSFSVNAQVQPTNDDKSKPEQLAEVLVTAEKRTERLEDVPAAVTVVNADDLVEQGAVSMQDYYATVPGLSIADLGSGQLLITMRGLSTGNGNPTVGITVDDVPLGQTVTADVDNAFFSPQFD